MDDLDRMSTRARSSGLVPEARLHASRTWDRGQRFLPTDSDPYRTQEYNLNRQTFEGRLTWRLDRLVFTDEELTIERLRVQRIELRAQIAGKVLRALFDWQRASAACFDTSLTDQERTEAMIRQAEAEAMLDVMTGGWFSGWVTGQSR